MSPEELQGRRDPRRFPAPSTRPSRRWSAPSSSPTTLGDHVFEWFIRNKRTEWEEYTRQVTPYELDRYLPAL